MTQTVLDEKLMKDLFKQALEELLQERSELFLELVAEAIEDYGLLEAIKEGEGTTPVSKAEVLRVLEGSRES